MKKISMFAVTTASALALGACAPTGSSTGAQSSSSSQASSAMDDDAMDDDSMDGPVTVGGAAMLPSRTIVENASNASNLTTLVQAVQAAGLVETLSGPGPFTVFAPTNTAFGRLPQAALTQLMQPASRAQLSQILTYHVVAGNMDSAALMRQIEAGGGSATLTTVEGSTLRAAVENGAISLTDEQGTTSFVTQGNVRQSNGIVHVINGVLIPTPATGPARPPAGESMDDMEDDSMDDNAMDDNGTQ